MISRTRIKCLTCSKPITARIQVGHELEQPVSFPCPHCGTLVQLTLILDEPPRVKIRWGDNAEQGNEEGAIINIGAGFIIPQNKLHEDLYFPSFDAPRPNIEDYDIPDDLPGPIMMDTSVALGTLPYAEQNWRLLERGLRFHRTGQQDNLNSQLDEFWGTPRSDEKNLENTLFNFILRFLEPNGQKWLAPLGKTLQNANSINPHEYTRLVSHYDSDLKHERFEAYSEIISEYFKAYSEFDQTLVYARCELALPPDAVATSSDFGRTKMFYGNAFEVLGAHLDVPAALNNIISGRSFDQMNQMDLKQFRTINKANRTNCFANNLELSWLISEYDSTIRNASHHRWFKLDDTRRKISYRSGGTGAVHHMTYAEYLMRCNRLVIQIMMLSCLELILLSTSGRNLS
jgi:predicted RNA-binding Zn-ribbon protein involved in translation (DUF1610 family)